MEFDLVVKNGLIVTASEIFPPGLEIGVKDGKIVCLGTALPTSSNTKVIDAEGAYITPGGIDSHVHLHQDNAPTGDNWETGTRSAIAGGTTTVLAFASQKRQDASLFPVVEEYHRRSDGNSYCDYGFHLILTNPTAHITAEELPAMVAREGITSVKLYMTYDPLKLDDRQLLDVMMAARALGITTMIHAENSDVIALIVERLEARGRTDPYYHAIARPQIAENEATYRAISLAELVDTPILIVHMSSGIAMRHVRKAQTRLLPIHAETCPQYLFLLSERLKGDHFEGAKCVCSPPLRHDPKDLEYIWQGIANGTFTTFSSDHAPSTFDHPGGKKLGLVDGIPRFRNIPNGVPGIETRVPLLFDKSTPATEPIGGTTSLPGKLSLPRFVALTSTNPAKLYGLAGVKGSIAPGYDADLVIWYPPDHKFAPATHPDGTVWPADAEGRLVVAQSMLHHGVDYTPYEGVALRNWPRYTILRGAVVWDRDGGGIQVPKSFGRFLKRGKGEVVTGRMGGVVEGMFEGERELWA